jgi:hypothetical protein
MFVWTFGDACVGALVVVLVLGYGGLHWLVKAQDKRAKNGR